jgi:gram positive anchor domain protein
MNKFKKLTMATFGMLATVAPATAVFADEPATTDNSTTEVKPADNVGRVNYVYKVKGTDTEIGKGFKEGVIGEDYVINPEVIENYKYSGVEGEATGKFSNETPTVTFYYESTTAETPATTEQPKEEKPAEKPAEDKKKDDVEPTTTTSTTTSTTDKKDDVTTTTPSTTLKPAEKPADKPKEEEKPAEVVNPTIEKPVETNTGDKIVGSTDKGQVIVANDKGETSVVAPEKVGGEVKSDGSIQVKDKSGKLVKIPTTGVEAALVSIMLAGGSASATGIATYLRSKRK